MNARPHAEAATKSVEPAPEARGRERSLRRSAPAGVALMILAALGADCDAAGRSTQSSFNVSATVVRTCAIRADSGASSMTVDASSHADAGARSGCSPASKAVLALETTKRAASSSITVRNPGTMPMIIRVAVQSDIASQPDAGRSAGLLVSPASFTIPPGGAQIVRILAPVASDNRQSHSLLLHDVSQLAAAGHGRDINDAPSIVVPVVFDGNHTPVAGWTALASR